MCGLAGSMKQLIIYRLIQGLGAGAVRTNRNYNCWGHVHD